MKGARCQLMNLKKKTHIICKKQKQDPKATKLDTSSQHLETLSIKSNNLLIELVDRSIPGRVQHPLGMSPAMQTSFLWNIYRNWNGPIAMGPVPNSSWALLTEDPKRWGQKLFASPQNTGTCVLPLNIHWSSVSCPRCKLILLNLSFRELVDSSQGRWRRVV